MDRKDLTVLSIELCIDLEKEDYFGSSWKALVSESRVRDLHTLLASLDMKYESLCFQLLGYHWTGLKIGWP